MVREAARHGEDTMRMSRVDGPRPARTARKQRLVATGVVAVVLAASPSAPAAGADASDEWPITECGTVDGKGCAPTSKRVDLTRPTFSNPTRITNPLFPATEVQSVVQVGTAGGKPFRSETTLLPETGVVDWYGTKVEVVLSQYLAWRDGRIEEMALDRYAQADDGSVWYFGEDVIDYANGTAELTEGTWLAGRDGPPAMIMPADPKVGDVYRAENIIGIVFEELTVKEVNQTLDGPEGPVSGAIVVDEFGATGEHSEKTLAPGYGEFLTTDAEDLEAVAVAIPTNAESGGVPVEIRRMLTAAAGTFEYVRSEDWDRAKASTNRIQQNFDQVRATQPPRVVSTLITSLRSLKRAIARENVARAEQRSVDIAESTIDLEARYLPSQDIEVERFHNHTQRLRAHAAADSSGGVNGEVASLEWISERLRDALVPTEQDEFDIALRALRSAADAGNLATAADHATRLGALLRNLKASPPSA
jgi:hypothetical protein